MSWKIGVILLDSEKYDRFDLTSLESFMPSVAYGGRRKRFLHLAKILGIFSFSHHESRSKPPLEGISRLHSSPFILIKGPLKRVSLHLMMTTECI